MSSGKHIHLLYVVIIYFHIYIYIYVMYSLYSCEMCNLTTCKSRVVIFAWSFFPPNRQESPPRKLQPVRRWVVQVEGLESLYFLHLCVSQHKQQHTISMHRSLSIYLLFLSLTSSTHLSVTWKNSVNMSWGQPKKKTLKHFHCIPRKIFKSTADASNNDSSLKLKTRSNNRSC